MRSRSQVEPQMPALGSAGPAGVIESQALLILHVSSCSSADFSAGPGLRACMPADLRVLSRPVLFPHPVPIHSALPVLASMLLQLSKDLALLSLVSFPKERNSRDFGSLWAVCCLLIHHIPISSGPSQPVLTAQYGLCDPHSIHVHQEDAIISIL